MAVRLSHSQEISALVEDLSSNRAVRRDAAIARLTVIGGRAAERLAAIVRDAAAPCAARVAALRVLEATGDASALESVLGAVDDSDARVVVAAIAAARRHLRGPHGPIVVDRLTAMALDAKRSPDVRTAAVRALSTLGQSTVRPLLRALAGDAQPEIAALAANPSPASSDVSDPEEVVAAAAAGGLPPHPETLRQALAQAGHRVTLVSLQAIVENLRRHELGAAAADRPLWLAARGAAHLALARRGSRLALYDLRETIERTKEPLPTEFLTALTAVGDPASTESVAAAYAASKRLRDAGWRADLKSAFQDIVKRERLTRRHAVIRKLQRRSAAVLEELWAGQ